MSSQSDYWEEAISTAAYECGLTLTPEQLACLAEAAERAHDHYGMAFYSPPASDRFTDLEQEFAKKLKEKEQELERYRNDAEDAVRRALRLRPDTHISVGRRGEVFRYGGRIEQIL